MMAMDIKKFDVREDLLYLFDERILNMQTINIEA